MFTCEMEGWDVGGREYARDGYSRRLRGGISYEDSSRASLLDPS